MATFKTKPRGDQASFVTSCFKCGGELTINHGRVDPHQCREQRPVTLAQIQAALDNR
jgi:hypothetical protein